MSCSYFCCKVTIDGIFAQEELINWKNHLNLHLIKEKINTEGSKTAL